MTTCSMRVSHKYKLCHLYRRQLAGYGSNLTEEGHVECDAAVINCAGNFGSVGAVTGTYTQLAECDAVKVF